MKTNQKLSWPAKLAHYTARKREGDASKLYWRNESNYSFSHICNVLAGRRKNEEIVNEAYKLARRRMKNSELA